MVYKMFHPFLLKQTQLAYTKKAKDTLNIP